MIHEGCYFFPPTSTYNVLLIWFDYPIGLPCTGAADNEMWGTENLIRNGDLKFCIKMVDEKLWY